jgi:hypothetical protein
LKLPGNIPPLPAIIQAGCLLTFVIAAAKAISEYPEKDTKRHIFLAGTLSVFLILLALRYQGAIDWYAVAGGVAGYQIIYRAATVWKQEGWRHTVSELFLLVLFVPLIILPSNVFAFTWLPAFAVFNVIAVATLLFFDRSFLPLAGLVIAFAAGKVAGGNAGAAVGVLIFLAAAIVVEAVRPYSVQEKPEGIIEDLERTAEDIGERYCLNPTLFHILAFMRSLPLRFNSFSRYSIDSLLLKRSGSDIEFMHRLLRDYFALRDLQPLFRSGNVPLRLQAVRSLGFQGDAAVGALGEFVRDEDPDTREAAAWALGRIASPETVQHIDAALDDEVERVRATAVSSTRNMIGADCSRLLSSIVDDSSLLVQRALIIRAFQESYFYTLFRIYDADSYVEKVMKNVERRDELRNIVFELISAKSDYRITAGAIRAAEKLKDSRAVPAIIEVLRSSASLREDAAEALGNIGDPRATKALKRAIYDRDKTVREAARSALLQLGVTEIEDSRWGFFSRFFRSALPERADDTSP